jgi:diaminohydroxyphosphoribosylaminopyrimidine deaminase/5-amino-6-(5-phosphoribosylamino)uracil reductase
MTVSSTAGLNTADELEYMLRAIELAKNAEGKTSPNPAVGCVLVTGGKIVGEGWHEGPGENHAEIAAIQAAGNLAKGSCAYVTLEPCNHHGRTGPCSEALIQAGISSVVYGVSDPSPTAAGGSVRLSEAGVNVRIASGEAKVAAENFLRPWCNSINKSRPYVFAKYACSLDGRVATRTGNSKWISGPQSRLVGHKLRQKTDAIIVGVGTILADNPSLDPRNPGQANFPGIKVILDTSLKTMPDARVLSSPGQSIIFCAENASKTRRVALVNAGAEVIEIGKNGQRPCLAEVLEILRKKDCMSVMIEGGPQILGTAFDKGLVDEVWTFIAPLILSNGPSAVEGEGIDLVSDAFRLKILSTESIDSDLFIQGLVIR